MRFFRKLRRKLPQRREIENHGSLGLFKRFMRDPELWAMNRNSVSKGVAAGVFSAFLPMPFEMAVAVLLAILMGGNLIFAFSLIWISNPLTWIPLYTPCYLLGTKLIGLEPIALNQFTTLKLNLEFGYHYVALWLGCLIIGTTLATLSHFLINRLWRNQVRSEWKSRQERRREKNQTTKKPQLNENN